MKHLFSPFEKIDTKSTNFIIGTWLLFIIGMWAVTSSIGTTHLFPTISQVLNGFSSLWSEGLVVHIASSLSLFLQSVLISVGFSLIIVWLSPLPVLKPLATFCSKLRYLPLTGITFYLSILIQGAREMQVWVLVIFMSTYLITSLIAVLKDIPEEEFDHAKTLGCNRWEMLWEVVIKGRFDYVIDVIRQNLAIVWMMIVSVESILAAAGGLGFLIKNSDKFMDHGKMIALQLVILILGLLLDFVLVKVRKITFRYSKF